MNSERKKYSFGKKLKALNLWLKLADNTKLMKLFIIVGEIKFLKV
ncbi:MAG: hypothetical protein N2511_01905 [Thermodesulfovibrionales bacterium]|nr:hypothetical protein [Thermodesulfovibrionales bacterium]